ncbi:MAG: hypothetical protein QME74_09665, partial [Candidatus Edwardsbacteria bacterium]|nr:hypothetical protein [Candidatus Edwardsbacteria bacterium]
EYLWSKADLLFELKEINEAKGLNDEALQIAKEIGRPDEIFNCKILNAKLVGLNDKEAGICELEAMLKEYNEDAQEAALRYELWKMNGWEENKTAALGLYKKLYEKTPKMDYKKRIDELS